MRSPKKYLSAVVLLLPLVVAAVLAHQPPAQADHPLSVDVVNTPLPVSGRVAIEGTPTVGVAGSVTIGNPAANPVLTRTVDSTQPYQAELNFSIATGQGGAPLPGIPAGKRLVIEHMSVYFFLVPASSIVFCGLAVQPNFSATDPMVCQDTGGGNYTGNAQTKVYIDAVTTPGTPNFQVNADNLASGGSATALISGYLVPIS